MYRAVNCDTWDDPWFSELELQSKLLFLYLITNRRSTPCGAFEITMKAMSFETGLDPADVRQILGQMQGEGRVFWWPDINVVFVTNFYRHQKCNPNFEKGAIRAARDMPDAVQSMIYKTYPELGTLSAPNDSSELNSSESVTQPVLPLDTPETNGSQTVDFGKTNGSQTVPKGREEEQSQNRVRVSTESEESQARPGAGARDGDHAAAHLLPAAENSGLAGMADDASQFPEQKGPREELPQEDAASGSPPGLSDLEPPWQDKAALLCRHGVSAHNARRLAETFPENALLLQIKYLPFRTARTPAILVKSIQEVWEEPTGFAEDAAKRLAEAEEEERAGAARQRRQTETTSRQARQDAAAEALAKLSEDDAAIEEFESAVISKACEVAFNRDNLRKNGRLGEPILRPIRDALLIERGLLAA